MSNRILVLIAISMIIGWSSDSYASEVIKQETKGPQSPAITVLPGGHSKVVYDISDKLVTQYFKEINQKFSECLEIMIRVQNKKLEELNNKLAELYVQKIGAADEEAHKWAQETIEEAPKIRKDIESKEELIEKYNTEFSKNLIGNTYTLFSYIFETIDSRLLALKKENQKINYEIAEENILFSEKSTPKINYVARRANFPNGSQIIIFCILGKFNRGMVSECPTLEFDENFHDNKVQSFRLIPNYGGIKASLRNTVRLPKEKQVLNNVEYMTTGEAILTEQVKKQFDETFKKFIQLAYTR